MLNLLKRAKNLWRLSEYEPMELNEVLPVGTRVSPVIRKPKMAQIIKVQRKDPLNEFIESN